MDPFFEFIQNHDFMHGFPEEYQMPPLFLQPPPVQQLQEEPVAKPHSPRIRFYISSAETVKSGRKKKIPERYISESTKPKKKMIKEKKSVMVKNITKKISLKKDIYIKESVEEKFVKRMKDRSRISYLPNPSISSTPRISIKDEFAYSEKPDSFDISSLKLPMNTPQEIRDLSVNLLRETRNNIRMSNQCYNYLAKNLLPKIYHFWNEKKDELNETDSHIEIGAELMKMVHEDEHFTFHVHQNTHLYAVPFSYFMKLYYLHLNIDEKIPSYIIPPDMDYYKSLIEKMKLFFQYEGMKGKSFGIGLLFHISVMMTEGVDVRYCNGGAPTQATIVRENMIREVFQIKKIPRKSH
jgi:hypothetical protein